MLVSVAIPVRNGGRLLVQAIEAVQRQVLPDGVQSELVVCDSDSHDGSVTAARALGAEVFGIPPPEFSHGGTRNLLMERSRGDVVAFLTQDAVPADDHWLAALMRGFEEADDVGLVFGPYVARPQASPMVRRELAVWFHSLSPDGGVRVDRLGPDERELSARALHGARGFFTDANGAVARRAWEQVRFRSVAYAEDHALALDMLGAGFAKVFVPDAAVVHSHDYSPWGWLRRSFDEARAVQAIYGLEDLGELRRLAGDVRGAVGADLRFDAAANVTGGMPAAGDGLRRDPALFFSSLGHHGARALGVALGARSGRLPPRLVRALSLERRA
jgi:rhamnosyltransferase